MSCVMLLTSFNLAMADLGDVTDKAAIDSQSSQGMLDLVCRMKKRWRCSHNV